MLSLTCNGSQALSDNVEAALDDRELTASEEPDGDGGVEVAWQDIDCNLNHFMRKLTSTDVSGEAGDGHHGQSEGE